MDVCIFAANNCSGGRIKQGLQSGGNSDTFTLNLAGNFGSTPSVKLDSFAMKFQTQQGSYEIPGSIRIEEEPEPIPEPTALLGLMAIAGAFKLLRQNQAEQSAN
ncbi:MAG: cistern family PEP-CTERM protein [Leptolyngbyaceae cyanobacterium SL_7_1]|nr:cistern family PEP-CTERM protein [Leptolyngbyaceae cyanobacterium SL_7_1]